MALPDRYTGLLLDRLQHHCQGVVGLHAWNEVTGVIDAAKHSLRGVQG